VTFFFVFPMTLCLVLATIETPFDDTMGLFIAFNAKNMSLPTPSL
jgi:hypothetical protein